MTKRRRRRTERPAAVPVEQRVDTARARNLVPVASPRRPFLCLLGIVLLGLGARCVALYVTTPTPLMGDEPAYIWRARLVAEGKGSTVDCKRPPACWYYYGALFRAFGESPTVARSGNVALGALSLFAIFYLGRKWGGDRTGLWAAGMAALFPELIAHTHYTLSETVYVFFILGGLCFLVSFSSKPAIWKGAVAGAFLGASALTREVGIVFPPLAVLWFLWFARQNLARGVAASGAFVVACGLTVLPWTLRLNRGSDHFVLLTNSTYYNLYIGNSGKVQLTRDGPLLTPQQHYNMLGRTPSQRELAAKKLALEAIRVRLPWWPLEKLASEVPKFFSPTSLPVLRLQTTAESKAQGVSWDLAKWAYKFQPEGLDTQPLRTVLIGMTVGSYVLVTVMGVAGFVLARSKAMALLYATFVVAQILPTVITFAEPRFRLQCMPLWIVGAAWVLSERRAVWMAAPWRTRVAALGCAIAMLLLIASRYRSVLSPHWC